MYYVIYIVTKLIKLKTKIKLLGRTVFMLNQTETIMRQV